MILEMLCVLKMFTVKLKSIWAGVEQKCNLSSEFV